MENDRYTLTNTNDNRKMTLLEQYTKGLINLEEYYLLEKNNIDKKEAKKQLNKK